MNTENTIDIATHGLYQQMHDFGIPEHCQEALAGYILEHKPTGNFLQKLLSNDLKGTFEAADDINSKAVRNYVLFLYHCAPSSCWGSPEKVKSWLGSKNEFASAIRKRASELMNSGYQRQGQALFNALAELNPALAESIIASDADPFYDDSKIVQFWLEVLSTY